MNIFYTDNQETHKTRGNLPHWTQHGKMHFVTFRLADSVPAEKQKIILRERQKWLASHREPYTDAEWTDYNRLFSERLDKWLKAGYGECIFAHIQYASVVSQALTHFEGERYLLDYWVIMANHVHVLVIPLKPYTLKEILHSWKSFTSKEINKLRGRSGSIWMHESFDHIVRSQKQLDKIRSYIVDNWKQTNQTALISKTEMAMRSINETSSLDINLTRPKRDASATL